MADSFRTPAALIGDSVFWSYHLITIYSHRKMYKFVLSNSRGLGFNVIYEMIQSDLNFIRQNELTFRKMTILKYVDVVHKSPCDKWFWSVSTVRLSIFDNRMLNDILLDFYVMKSTNHYSNAMPHSFLIHILRLIMNFPWKNSAWTKNHIIVFIEFRIQAQQLAIEMTAFLLFKCCKLFYKNVCLLNPILC